jgi:hypothetical protein
MPNTKHQLSKSYIREKLHCGIPLGPIADELGISANFLSMWKSERSTCTIPMNKIVAFARACPGVDPAALLIFRLREELGEPELKVLWATTKLLDCVNADNDEIHDACVELARASHDCDAQLERICREEGEIEVLANLNTTHLTTTTRQ